MQGPASARFSHATLFGAARRAPRLVFQLPNRLAAARERRSSTSSIGRHEAEQEDGGLPDEEEQDDDGRKDYQRKRDKKRARKHGKTNIEKLKNKPMAMVLPKKVKDIKEEEEKKPQKIGTQNVFIGSTSELMKALRENGIAPPAITAKASVVNDG